MLRLLTIFTFICMATKCMAAASVTGPEDGDLEAGSSIQPYGEVDVSHLENGQTVTVDIKFTNAAGTGSTTWANVGTFDDWIANNSYEVPDWPGGTWEVKVKVDGVVLDTNNGDIIQGF